MPIYNLGHGFTYIAFNQILNDFYLSFGLDEKVRIQFQSSFLKKSCMYMGNILSIAQQRVLLLNDRAGCKKRHQEPVINWSIA